MLILKKKKKLIFNNLDDYSIYLKNLNFLNKLKKKEKILLKDIFLLNLKNFYLLNLNSKKNFFVNKINLNYNKKKIFYTIYKNKNENDLLINFKITYFILNLYTHLLFQKIKKYQIKKFFIKTYNKNKEILYIKKRNFFPYIKGYAIKYASLKKKRKYKKKNRKYMIVFFFSLVKRIKTFELCSRLKNLSFIKNLYIKKRFRKRTRLNPFFKKFKKNNKIFKILDNNKNIKFNSSRKAYVFDFREKNQKNTLKLNYDLYNSNLLKKYSKIFIEK